jgi:zinc transport system permease protein
MNRALIAGVLIAVICALIGVFIVLKRLAPIGDGFAHIAFGGIAVGIVSGIYPLGVALVFCVLAALLLIYLQSKKIYGEVGVSIAYAAGLSIGILILSKYKQINADLFSYLFGNILAISNADLLFISILAVIVIVCILALKSRLLAISFDEEWALSKKLPVMWINIIFFLLTAITVVITLRMVGMMLVSALLVIPAASAMYIAKGINKTLIIATIISILGVVGGIVISYYLDVATSASIILCQVGLFVLCLVMRRFIGRI